MSSPVPPLPPIEPDPFKNARGLSAMFGRRRGSGPPLWPFLLAAVGILALVALRIQAAVNERNSREQALNASYQFQRDMNELDRSPFGQLPRSNDTPTYTEQHDTGPSAIDVRAHADQVCTRLAACGPNAGDPSVVTDCVSQQMAVATDALGRTVLDRMLYEILTTCDQKRCEEFTTCYFDVVKKQSADALGPAQAVSAGDRARLKELVCVVARESNGKVPDTHAPTASKNVKELDALLLKLGPNAAADIVKEAVKECDPSEPSAGH